MESRRASPAEMAHLLLEIQSISVLFDQGAETDLSYRERERERERERKKREIERQQRGWGEGDRGEIADRIRDRRECGNFEEVFYLL